MHLNDLGQSEAIRKWRKENFKIILATNPQEISLKVGGQLPETFNLCAPECSLWMMFLFLLCCAVLMLGYVGLMLLYRVGWTRQKKLIIPPNFTASTRISVIIPARNEAQNIEACIQSIAAQDYPESLLEIILVDDHSVDNTARLAMQAAPGRVRVIALQEWMAGRVVNAYKKEALQVGISQSRGELIVTTDGDCIAGKGWLRAHAYLFEQCQAALIIGPVSLEASGREVELFQSIDFMMMQGITVAAHQLNLGGMANGANLAFSHKAFEAVNGYEGTQQLASGDDYLLLHKMNQAFPGRIQLLHAQEAIVRTVAQKNWYSFLQQRIRWASKSGRYSDHRLTFILTWVYLFNLSLLVLGCACFWQAGWWRLLVACLLLKVISELLVLWPAASFFRKKRELFAFPIMQPLHILYIVVAGLLGMKGGYRWKGRQVH